MVKKTSLLTVLWVMFFVPLALCQSGGSLFAEAKAAQAAGKSDVAFLLYRQIIRQYPSSEYAEEAQFLVGQYYYDSRNYFDASQTLRAYLRRFPRSRFSDTAREYLGIIRLGSLKERADRLFEEGKLGPASVLYQQYLDIDPDNPEVKAQLALIKKTQKEVHFGFEQLSRERKELQQEKVALEKQVTELERQRKQVLTLQNQALELNKLTIEKYEKRLAEVSVRIKGLNTRIAALEKELQGWRQRAVLAEATRLSGPEGEGLPLIVSEGKKADPSPVEGEVELSDIVREGFPAIVVTQAKLDAKKNLRHVEAVVSVDLASPWPEGAKMKFRVDFIAKEGQPPPDPQFLVRYFDALDMDEMEETTHSYRKRVVFTADEKKIERYEISAFLVIRK